MQQSMFKTKKVGRCEACREQTQGEEKLELIQIINTEFWLCDQCVIGQEDCTLADNQEFVEKYGKKVKKINRRRK